MKPSTLLAIFVASLALAHHAQGADAESAKGALTQAEKTQCRAQRAEFNQSVRSYNAALDALKSLEAEIHAQQATIEKQGVVDRSDSAALDARYADLRKIDEMAERYQQRSASIKAMSSDNEQHADQLRDRCENRPTAMSLASKTQPLDSACSSATGAKDAERQIQASLDEIQADQEQRQAEVDRIAEARAAAQSWSDEQRNEIWMHILGSSRFIAFENEKQPYVQELTRVMESKPSNSHEQCQFVQRIAAMLPAIKAINARQYAFMADEIRMAK